MFVKRGERRPTSYLLDALLFALLVVTGCAAPIRDLWPPRPEETSYRLIVSIDSWHSVIGVWPEDDPEGRNMAELVEWSYAERGFYLDGDNGSSGTMRAMLWPSEGVVQVAQFGRPWVERSHDPPARSWSFELSREGYDRLRAHLARERLTDVPIRAGRSTWYSSRHSYHIFHHCHHWTARALRAAGLPLWSCYATLQWALESQLDRAQEMAQRP